MTRVFFTDRDLGKQFPSLLIASGLTVERHGDHFAPDAADEEWLAFVGGRGWIAITHDQRIRYKPNERDAVLRNGVALLVVIGKAPYADLAKAFLNTMPAITAFLAAHRPPFIAKVYSPSLSGRRAASGRVELWYPAVGP